MILMMLMMLIDANDAILPTLAAWLLDCCDSGPNIKNDFARGCHSELKLQSWRIIATPRSPKECPLSYMLTSATRMAHCGHLLGSLALHHMHRGYRKKSVPKRTQCSQCSQCSQYPITVPHPLWALWEPAPLLTKLADQIQSP
jgi:hypothetical protein